MHLRPFEGKKPIIEEGVYIDSTALVIGNVVLARDSSVWPMAVIRGDVNSIEIGRKTNIQDGAVVHVTHDGPFTPGGHSTLIGNNVTVGHQATIHACEIQGSALIGMGARILDAAIVEKQVIVGAGSLVSAGKRLESGYLYLGTPVKRIRPLTEKEIAHIDYSANYYCALASRHRESQASNG